MTKRTIRPEQILFFLVLTTITGPSGAAFAEGSARLGDPVRAHYVCRFENGEVAAATLGESKLACGEKRSEIFQPLRNDAPLSLHAGVAPESQGGPGVHDFSDEIASQIAHALVGLKPGEKRMVKISADRARYRERAAIAMPRIRRRPVELRLRPDEYGKRTGRQAKVGTAFTLDPAFSGKVVSVTADEVLIRFAAPAANPLKTPFGPATVRVDGNQYLVEIHARRDALVRSGSMLGRVVAFDEKTFTVDYGHPLAGRNLDCEVTILPSGTLRRKSETTHAMDR